jgi:NAD(P)-dependent dehydrogenase (short-subunit alcohol dehydrogenase family)
MLSFKHQESVEPLSTRINLTGKTILITGANQGIGFECARQLLQLQTSMIVLAVRTVSKGEAARDLLYSDPAIKGLTARPIIKVMQLDMAEYNSVLKFAETVKRELKELNMVLLNAGCGQLNYEVAPTGHEKVFQINYLSNVLLALELLPFLEKTATLTGVPSRLSWVGSRAQLSTSFANKRPYKAETSIAERMDNKKLYSGTTVYGDTKLFVAMFVRQLAQKVDSKKVVINNMCPGMIATGMSDVLPFPLRQLMNGYKSVYARPVEVAGWIVLNGLVLVGAESHGKFLIDKRIAE